MKIHQQLFNIQLIELSSSSEIGNIIQKGEVIFKENPQSVYQKYLSQLTQQQARHKVTKGNTVFLIKKKCSIKEKTDSL